MATAITDTDPCEICAEERATPVEVTGGYDGIAQRCPRCGDFKLSGSVLPAIRKLSREERVKLSGWTYHQTSVGEIPEITSYNLKGILSLPIPGIIERADRLLNLAARLTEELGGEFDLNIPAFIAATYSNDWDEVYYLAKFYHDQGYINMIASGVNQVSPGGYLRLEEISSRISGSNQGFVAMWFEEKTQVAFDAGFEPAIRKAGYSPFRIDRHEHINMIDDEIIAQIKKSRFLVADFTGQRGGVYFEAGFALGLNIPVFWTCYKEEIKNLHFDVRQFNCIDWETPEDLFLRLRNRIEAVVGTGPLMDE